jgi:acetyltransferase-like isoleucine patch superfamily enzyme
MVKKIILFLYSIFSYFSLVNFKKVGPNARVSLFIGFNGFRQNIIIGSNFQMDAHAMLIAERSMRGCILIGNNFFIGRSSIIKCYGGKVKIGSNVSINPFCYVSAGGGVTIGDDVRIAAHTSIIASNHNFEDCKTPIRLQGISAKGVKIENDVWIGAGVQILDGVTIGRGAVIGAGAVVTKDVDCYGIYVGNPARKIRSRIISE